MEIRNDSPSFQRIEASAVEATPAATASEDERVAQFALTLGKVREQLGELVLTLRSAPDLSTLNDPAKTPEPPRSEADGGIPPMPKGGDDRKSIENLMKCDWSRCTLDELLEGLSRIAAYANAHRGWAEDNEKGLLAVFSAMTTQLNALIQKGGISPETLQSLVGRLNQITTTLETIFPRGGEMRRGHRPEEVRALLETLGKTVSSAVGEYLKGVAEKIRTMELDQAIMLFQKTVAMLNSLKNAGAHEYDIKPAAESFFKEALTTLTEMAGKKLDEFKKMGGEAQAFLADMLQKLKQVVDNNALWADPAQHSAIGTLAGKAATLLEIGKLEKALEKQGWGIGDDIESILRKMQEVYNRIKEALPELAKQLGNKIGMILERIESLKKSGIVDVSTREMEMAIMLTQIGRARISEAVLKDQMDGIKERNDKIRLLNIILGKIHERAGKDTEVSLKDLYVQVGNDNVLVAFLLKDLGVLSGNDYAAWFGNMDKKFNINALCNKQIQGKIDDLNHEQQTDMNRMQSLSSKRNEAYEALTNFVRKMDDQLSTIISHMG